MGYRVEYQPAMKNEGTMDKRLQRPWALTAAFLIAFGLFTNAFWPDGQKVLQEILWPGDMEVTQQAVEAFVTELRYGEPFTDAVEGFCREILQDADIR